MTDEKTIMNFEKKVNAIEKSTTLYLDEADMFEFKLLMKDILEIVKKQKAEIEKCENIIRLADKTIEKQSELIDKQKDYIETLEIEREAIRTKAREEFAERLKEKAVDVGICDAQGNGYGGATVILIGDIDNLVKETVGEEK